MQVALASTPPLPAGSPQRAADPGSGALAEREALAVGSCISEFRILRVLGSGGFGMVYLVYDNSLQRNVALKEYLPAMWAGRGPGGRLTVRSASFADAFAVGLSSFVNEARLLARFDHPSLVKVHRFWEADGTAYMVMPYYEGASLRQLRDAMDEPPTEAWLRRLLDSLLGALEVMHAASVFHRDVAPDNILLAPSGLPVLLDFGAARHVLMGQTQVLTAILKPLYAPIEQYARESEVRQGPWTDIYAVAATMHHALTGQAPATSASRVVHDTHRPLHQREVLGASSSGPAYDPQWLAALDWGLAVLPQARPQSIAQWREALAGRLAVPQATPPSPAPVVAAPRAAADAHFPATELHMRPGPAPGGAHDAPADVAASVDGTVPAVPAVPASPSPGTSRHGRSARRWAAPGLVALVLAAGLWWLQAGHPAPAAAELRLAEPAATAATSDALAAPPPRVEPAAESAHELPLAPPEPAPAATPPARTAATPRPPKRFKPQVTTSPQQICAKLGFFSRFSCLRKTCATAKWARHPQCTNEERVGYHKAPVPHAPDATRGRTDTAA